MSDPGTVWTHISDEQASGRACVMCGRRTDEPGWKGRPVGRGPDGNAVYACQGGEVRVTESEDSWGNRRPFDARAAGRNCADQAAIVAPDTIEGLGL